MEEPAVKPKLNILILKSSELLTLFAVCHSDFSYKSAHFNKMIQKLR